MKAVCRFKFPRETKREFIEASIASAILNAEAVYGKPKVRVSGVAYYLAEDSPQCIIDVSSEVGEHVAQVFTGVMINTLGDNGFSVKRIQREEDIRQLAKAQV
jgi:hypothetical protein